MGDKLTVLDPTGFPPKVVGKQLAPRLDTLDGKTIYLVDCRFDDSDVFLGQLRDWFAQHLPATRTKLVQLSNVYTRDDPATWERIKADGDGAIIGVGH
jgi:hypothetical protein